MCHYYPHYIFLFFFFPLHFRSYKLFLKEKAIYFNAFKKFYFGFSNGKALDLNFHFVLVIMSYVSSLAF